MVVGIDDFEVAPSLVASPTVLNNSSQVCTTTTSPLPPIKGSENTELTHRFVLEEIEKEIAKK